MRFLTRCFHARKRAIKTSDGRSSSGPAIGRGSEGERGGRGRRESKSERLTRVLLDELAVCQSGESQYRVHTERERVYAGSGGWLAPTRRATHERRDIELRRERVDWGRPLRECACWSEVWYVYCSILRSRMVVVVSVLRDDDRETAAHIVRDSPSLSTSVCILSRFLTLSYSPSCPRSQPSVAANFRARRLLAPASLAQADEQPCRVLASAEEQTHASRPSR